MILNIPSDFQTLIELSRPPSQEEEVLQEHSVVRSDLELEGPSGTLDLAPSSEFQSPGLELAVRLFTGTPGGERAEWAMWWSGRDARGGDEGVERTLATEGAGDALRVVPCGEDLAQAVGVCALWSASLCPHFPQILPEVGG